MPVLARGGRWQRKLRAFTGQVAKQAPRPVQAVRIDSQLRDAAACRRELQGTGIAGIAAHPALDAVLCQAGRVDDGWPSERRGAWTGIEGAAGANISAFTAQAATGVRKIAHPVR